jgi:outer membrane protein TolC
MRYQLLFSLLFIVNLQAQQNDLLVPNEVFSFNEYLGYVKKFHPLVKNAALEINRAQANLMQARGAFDPKLEVDFNTKEFKDKDYYSLLNSSFKIPTWYGIEVKAGFESNQGVFLNPQNNVPTNGIGALGISVPLGQGLLINQRMADIRTAKEQVQMSQAQQNLQAIEVLYDAAIAYFDWKKNHDQVQLYSKYQQNAIIRLNGVKQLIIEGDKRAIDSVEAKITVTSRQLDLENAKLKLLKSRLALSNFLWLENNVPVEINENLIPENELQNTIRETLNINLNLEEPTDLSMHPKMITLQTKVNMLDIERKLKANKLLPKLNVGYTYLTEPQYINDVKFENYKLGIDFAYPLFLRKERAGLKLTKLKIQEAQNILTSTELQLNNKISAQKQSISSLDSQRKLIGNLVVDYTTMLKSEERLFSFGESSLFLINSRENSLITAKIKEIELNNYFYESNAELYKILAQPN